MHAHSVLRAWTVTVSLAVTKSSRLDIERESSKIGTKAFSSKLLIGFVNSFDLPISKSVDFRGT